MPDEYQEYDVTLSAIVTAPTLRDAETALLRSGISSGSLIGEVLITDVEVQDK